MEKYVKLRHVEELLKLIHTRDGYYDWSDSYAKYHSKVQNTVEWLKRNAKTQEELSWKLMKLVTANQEAQATEK